MRRVKPVLEVTRGRAPRKKKPTTRKRNKITGKGINSKEKERRNGKELKPGKEKQATEKEKNRKKKRPESLQDVSTFLYDT